MEFTRWLAQGILTSTAPGPQLGRNWRSTGVPVSSYTWGAGRGGGGQSTKVSNVPKATPELSMCTLTTEGHAGPKCETVAKTGARALPPTPANQAHLMGGRLGPATHFAGGGEPLPHPAIR